jgi:peptidoglycan/LPS O-acetylase OafA/YrhL
MSTSTIAAPIAEAKKSLGHIPALDGLRGLAVLMVMLFHLTDRLDSHSLFQQLLRSPFGQFGWTGVDLFFVLSGFLITGILIDTRGAQNYFSGFYARRFLRIFPLYYVSLAVLFFVFTPALGLKPVALRQVAAYALYAQNVLPLRVDFAGHFWSLAVEEQFYAVWPLIVYVLPARALLRTSIVGIVACDVLRLTLLAAHLNEIVNYNPFTRADALLWGAVGACLLLDPVWRRRISAYTKHLWIAPIAALALMKFSPEVGHWPGSAFAHVGYSAVAASYTGLLLSVVLGGSQAQRLFTNSAMRFLGKYSYAAYVWHIPVAQVFYQAEGRAFGHVFPQLLNIPIVVAATLLVSMASYVVIERPFLRLKRYFEPRQLCRA